MLSLEVASVLTEIADLLADAGEMAKVEWLRARLLMLRSPETSPEDMRRIRHELNGIVLGMGGLFDLSLEAPSTSKLTGIEARRKLDRLSDRLYRLTRT